MVLNPTWEGFGSTGRWWACQCWGCQQQNGVEMAVLEVLVPGQGNAGSRVVVPLVNRKVPSRAMACSPGLGLAGLPGEGSRTRSGAWQAWGCHGRQTGLPHTGAVGWATWCTIIFFSFSLVECCLGERSHKSWGCWLAQGAWPWCHLPFPIWAVPIRR